ncbi:ABC transporter ATP-binding protein [Sediminispirochaeta smaragdinae]|uniref:ABC transporter related protein n=1 Tax=Sediminispirochaeta smaragdinae (strain DSM 11293 / JCM 15392 / SEBR 4228) TaxID=573413 RepID=E1R778_SEDSS|nr:ABC transporter ATP-binding protein [Sediminispirochaeta smaragdinae]ADK82583.1 ABC transporter related protein [Sediminispirochaeta smaragdinae DSM 11293]
MGEKQMQSGFSRLKELAAGHRGSYIASVVFAILGVAGTMVPYIAVSHIIIKLIEGQRSFAFYLSWCAVAALGYLAKSLFHSISTTLSHKATFAVISELRYRIAEKLTRVPMGYVLNTPSGKIKNSMVEKVDSIEPALAHVLPEMTSNLLIPLCIVCYLFVLDWRMALISLITLPIGALCYMGMMKDYETKFGKYVGVSKHMNATAVEYINGIEVIKAFGQSASSYAKFSKAVRENAEYGLSWMKEVQIYFAMGIGIWPSVLIGVLPLGCVFYMNGSLSAPVFITVMILALGIVAPLLSALYYTDDIAKIGTIMGDIGSLLDEKELIRPRVPAKPQGLDIKLHNLSFSYDKIEILHNVSLSIPAFSVTALVGPSGGGKSTIAKLIASFWDVDGGSVSIGGVDVKNIPSEQLNDMIAYVAQDTYLFDETVLENIRMGNPKASDDAVKAVAQSAGCHDFILSLEHGYDTVAGGAGGHLSGGERQRIAIARAMLKDAPIVILDEATAYTDPENESVIQSAIAKLVEGKTLIVIAHRLSTITDSDQIIVIDRGRVADWGRHEELLASSPLYRSMWQAHISAKDNVKDNVYEEAAHV